MTASPQTPNLLSAGARASGPAGGPTGQRRQRGLWELVVVLGMCPAYTDYHPSPSHLLFASWKALPQTSARLTPSQANSILSPGAQSLSCILHPTVLFQLGPSHHDHRSQEEYLISSVTSESPVRQTLVNAHSTPTLQLGPVTRRQRTSVEVAGLLIQHSWTFVCSTVRVHAYMCVCTCMHVNVCL